MLLKNVFIIDIDKYMISNVKILSNSCSFILKDKNNISELKVYSYFKNGELYWVNVYINKGPLILRSKVKSIKDFKGYIFEFIKRYKEFFNVSSKFYDNIAKAISKIKALNYKQIVVEDNVLVEVYTSDLGVCIYCRLIVNNATTLRLFGLWLPAPSKLPVTNGMWTSIGFYDKYRFTRIADAKITFTRQEAIDKTIKLMKEYFSKHPEELCGKSLEGLVKNVETKLVYAGRGEDTLYPLWQVWIYFKETLPNGVYGYSTSIWADTGELRTSNVLGLYHKANTPTHQYNPLMIPSILALITALVIIYLLTTRKRAYGSS